MKTNQQTKRVHHSRVHVLMRDLLFPTTQPLPDLLSTAFVPKCLDLKWKYLFDDNMLFSVVYFFHFKVVQLI